MQIDMSKASYDGRWFDFGAARLKIRPYPASRQDITIKDGAIILSGDAGFDMFSYCLTEWEGVTDADDKPLQLTVDVKKKLYDLKLGQVEGEALSDFVLKTTRTMNDEIGNDTKN